MKWLGVVSFFWRVSTLIGEGWREDDAWVGERRAEKLPKVVLCEHERTLDFVVTKGENRIQKLSRDTTGRFLHNPIGKCWFELWCLAALMPHSTWNMHIACMLHISRIRPRKGGTGKESLHSFLCGPGDLKASKITLQHILNEMPSLTVLHLI